VLIQKVLTLAPNTVSGTYSIVYQLCEVGAESSELDCYCYRCGLESNWMRKTIMRMQRKPRRTTVATTVEWLQTMIY
jgi:hypothetical protein